MPSDSKIDLLDPPEVVAKKIRKAEAFPQVVEGNGVLAFVEFVLLPASGLKGKREFRVDRERDGLEPLVYTSISQIQDDYKNDVVRLMGDLDTYIQVVEANSSPAYTTNTKTGRHESPVRAHGAHPRSLQGIGRMAGDKPESLPPARTKKEGKKTKGIWYAFPGTERWKGQHTSGGKARENVSRRQAVGVIATAQMHRLLERREHRHELKSGENGINAGPSMNDSHIMCLRAGEIMLAYDLFIHRRCDAAPGTQRDMKDGYLEINS